MCSAVHSLEGHPCAWSLQRGGRRSVASQTSASRMVFVPRRVSEDSGSMGDFRGGPLRHSRGCESFNLRILALDQLPPRRVSVFVGQVVTALGFSAHTAYSGPDSQDKTMKRGQSLLLVSSMLPIRP